MRGTWITDSDGFRFDVNLEGEVVVCFPGDEDVAWWSLMETELLGLGLPERQVRFMESLAMTGVPRPR